MPPTHMTSRPRRFSATLSQTPFATYAISAPDDAPRPTQRTRSQTAILDGNAPSRPDYRTAAHSGFAASAASVPPPLRTSPPPRSARLGSTTSTGRLASISSTPTPPDLQSDSPLPTAPLHTTHMSRTAILDDNAPSRPDYRTAAHSGFAASAASAPLPLRTLPPPRLARLGSTTSTGRLGSNSSTPTPPDLQSDSPPPTAPLHPTVPDLDVQAAAAHLSKTLLNYTHSDWEQAQREDHLCNAPHRYIQLGCSQPLPTSLCDHIPSHQRPGPADS